MREVMVHRCDREGWVALTFPFDPELVALVKALRQRRWDAKERRWLVGVSQMDALVSELRRRNVAVRSGHGDRQLLPGAAIRASPEVTRAAQTELTLRGYSGRTRVAYMKVIQRFMADVEGEVLTAELMREWLLERVKQGVSRGYHGQLVAA